MQLKISINDEEVARDVEPRQLLVHYIRDTAELTGTHWGCDTSNCGACVVLMDGKPVKSCTILAAMAEGHAIETVESLEQDGQLDPIQMGFHECHALQCGFCTPGMLMTGRALLNENPDPSDQEIRTAISGAICRCTGYKNIVAAVVTAKDLETLGLAWMPTISYDTQAVLAGDKVRFQGQEVAFVIATDEYSARDALPLIDVEYDPLPTVVNARRALDDDAPLIRDDKEYQTDNLASPDRKSV